MQNISQLLSQEIKDLVGLKHAGQKIYLVGGAIRDFCVGRKNQDVDILCNFDTRLIARRFADTHRGDFFVMDARRNISRVILPGQAGKRIFDFARLRATDLEGDLRARDFTINAMALDLDQPYRIIDPLHGQTDLEQRILRSCSPASFKDDPVRIVRAFRYSHSLDLKIEDQTFILLREVTPLLENVSMERKRDELFKILDLHDSENAIKQLFELRIHQSIGFPEKINYDLFEKEFVFLRTILNEITDHSSEKIEKEDQIHPEIKLKTQTAEQLHTFLTKKNSSDRNDQQLILLSLIMSSLNSSEAKDVASQLLLSREEIDKIGLIKQRTGVKELWETRRIPGDRELYHFFRVNGESGVDIALIILAELWSGKTGIADSEDLDIAQTICEHTIAFWFEKPNVAHPVLLLNGNDLMVNFDLIPGPLVGELIEGLREEQAAGSIQTRSEAMEWVEKRLTGISARNSWE